jgi:hypothetical protein
LKYPPFPWAQNFQDGAHPTTGAQRKIFENVTIFFGHPVLFWDTLLVAQLVEALRYKSEGRGFDSRSCYWNFSLT